MALVTVQLGSYANFVGAHWCNIQRSSFCSESRFDPSSEVLHGSMYREGQKGPRKEVDYTPRLIAIGLPPRLHSTAREELHEEDKDSSKGIGWDGDMHMIIQESAPHKLVQTGADVMDFRDASPKEKRKGSDLGVWSDYLLPQLHPQSLLTIPVRTTREGPLHCFPQGESLLSDQQFAEDLDQRLHFFVEECDHFQGLQVLTDIHNGFSGLVSSSLEGLADEYGARKIVVVVCYPTALDDGQVPTTAVLNSALAVERIVANSAMLLPLSLASQLWPAPANPHHLPHLDIKYALPYHTSAVLASALDTSTLLYRTRHSQCSLADTAAAVTEGGRQVASLGCALPLPLTRGSSLADLLTRPLHTHLTPLTPYLNAVSHMWGQKWVVRGIPSDYSINQLHPPQSPTELFLSHLVDHTPHSPCSLHWVQQPLPTSAPCPDIFPPTAAGLALTRSRYGGTVTSVPMATCLASCEGTHELLASLKDGFLGVNLSHHHGYPLSRDTQGSIVQALDKLSSNYKPLTDCH